MFKKKITALIISAAVALTGVTAFGLTHLASGTATSAKAAETDEDDDEVRGIWLSIYDYSKKNIGLCTDDEATFRANAKKFLTNLSNYHLNTVYMQVRSNDDAAWKSKLFPAMTWISPAAKALGTDNSTQSAYETLSFDPLQIMTEEAHAQNIKLIAWMNPYRITSSVYLNPGASSSQTRVVKAVKEVMKYDVDGVIFDDYFYNASSKYPTSSSYGYKNIVKNKITLTIASAAKLSSAKKCAYVDKLIARVYNRIKTANPNATFGIAPQGNLTNDLSAGADVKTWLSKDGYIDYLMPQLYWTDDWGKDGGITVSGGEPLLQIDFLLEFFRKAREEGISTCIDTAGEPFTRQEPWFSKFKELMKVTDLLLMDIKQIDRRKHIALTGKPNDNILDMFRYLSSIGKPIWIRQVLVPGWTDDPKDLEREAAFIHSLTNVQKVEILPYHTMGEYKWKKLGIKYSLDGVCPPDTGTVARAENILRSA